MIRSDKSHKQKLELEVLRTLSTVGNEQRQTMNISNDEQQQQHINKKFKPDDNDHSIDDQRETTTKKKYNVLILGGSYGSLFGIKLVMAGHDVTLICTQKSANIFNEKGSVVKIPIRDLENKFIDLNSHHISTTVSGSGKLTASTPDQVVLMDASSTSSIFDLVVLAMQEPQYSAPDVRNLVLSVAKAGIPVMAITNMPLLPYLARIPALGGDGGDAGVSITQHAALRSCYTDPELWDAFLSSKKDGSNTSTNGGDSAGDIGLTSCEFTQCSPDPQAFRPDSDGGPNVLQVRLPTNFKAARFEADGPTEMLRQLEEDIQNIRYKYDDDADAIEIPVKLRVHDSVMVPLAKWAMLLAGNYRCIQKFPKPVISIQEAVVGDDRTTSSATPTPTVANQVYDWVVQDLCCDGLGGKQEDFVPFSKYAKAAQSLKSPSSAARALQNGATNIERVDKVVQLLGLQRGKHLDAVDEIVQIVDEWLLENKKKETLSSSNEGKPAVIKRFYPIGTPGVPWTPAEDDEWRKQCEKHRSYDDDVLQRLNQLRDDGSLTRCGLRLEEYPSGLVKSSTTDNNYTLMAIVPEKWSSDPTAINVLVTGGVHGYETSGVHGAIHFVANDYETLLKSIGSDGITINLVVCPCVTPWAYEHVQRWNADLQDPNRSFKVGNETPESCAVMTFLQELQRTHGFTEFDIHLDLHETTDTDETEFMPAKHAKAGLDYNGETIPDGFYLVADEKALAEDVRQFHRSVLQAVQHVTHLAPADTNGNIIDIPIAEEALILVPARDLGICGGGATPVKYVGTTEVYPDSDKLPQDPAKRSELCNQAQSAAIHGAIDFLISKRRSSGKIATGK